MDNSTFLQEQIEKGRFFLDFIPRNDAATGETIAQEAVVWYSTDDNRIISAECFLSEYEEWEEATRLDVWLMDEVCKLWKNMAEARVNPILLNISDRTVQNPYCLYDMILSVKNYGVKADSLHIVLTSGTVDGTDQRLERGITFLKLNNLKVTDRNRQESVNFNENK